MNDLLKKLNALVKASLNDKISGVTGGGAGGNSTARRPSKTIAAIDNDIAGLRQRINEAVEYEDEIQARIRQFEDEAARWDRQADDAVAQGNDTNARYAIEQMKRAEQRAALAQSDLREHQQATQELIQRVNTLEAVVADAKVQAEQAKTAEVQEPESTQPESATSEDAQANLRIPDLSNILHDARDKITSLSETVAQRADQDLSTPTEAAAAPDAQAEVRQDKVDDELERRRERLSKR